MWTCWCSTPRRSSCGGRVAQYGLLLFDDDPPARVRWVATTRKIYADERPRIERSHREFAESRRGR
ncbi:hypothetical protein [Actinomycetospora chibensis]|uniref:Uncharacterized protein n=1 Tax=Actinomycetospora chibensis TaxID=663606 RepID=A0ABV9RLL9_9PSEU|nr:hypothetical protein [Actinomycetospora chibensis]MDD7927194.1 hypothetical protein [Actinomycetospora chibensis]